MDDLNNAMDALNALEERRNRTFADPRGRVLVGMTGRYFKGLNVVAIKLEDTLKIGDIIEMGDVEEAVRQRVSSMQIDRNDVSEAHAGDSIGIKTKYPIPEGSSVYRL